MRNRPLAPTSIGIKQVSNVCGNRIYRYTAPLLPAATANNVAASGYQWTMPTGPVGSTGVLDSGSLTSRIIRIRYSSNSAAGSTDSIRVAYTSSCGNSSHKAIRLSNVRRTGCGGNGNRIAFDETPENWAVQAYPNPSTEDFSVFLNFGDAYEGNTEKVSYVIYDSMGKMKETGESDIGETIQVGKKLQPGLYYLVAVLNNEKKILRLMKQ